MSHTVTNEEIRELCKELDALVKELAANTAIPPQMHGFTRNELAILENWRSQGLV